MRRPLRAFVHSRAFPPLAAAVVVFGLFFGWFAWIALTGDFVPLGPVDGGLPAAEDMAERVPRPR